MKQLTPDERPEMEQWFKKNRVLMLFVGVAMMLAQSIFGFVIVVILVWLFGP